MTRKEYIDKYKQLVIDSTKGTGLFPSVMLAQGIVESGNGNSTLASKYNNHFGIKVSKAWKGKGVNMKTREVVNNKDEMQNANFRVYDNPKEGFQDRVKFLQENGRYAKAGVFTAKSPIEQLMALQRAGYATDPNYAKIINSVIGGSLLFELDKIKEIVSKNKGSIGGFLFVASSLTVLYFVTRK